MIRAIAVGLTTKLKFERAPYHIRSRQVHHGGHRAKRTGHGRAESVRDDGRRSVGRATDRTGHGCMRRGHTHAASARHTEGMHVSDGIARVRCMKLLVEACLYTRRHPVDHTACSSIAILRREDRCPTPSSTTRDEPATACVCCSCSPLPDVVCLSAVLSLFRCVHVIACVVGGCSTEAIDASILVRPMRRSLAPRAHVCPCTPSSCRAHFDVPDCVST
jgi:hypothetical protein